MNSTGPLLFMNSTAHFMQPGSVAFIPAWIILEITAITIVILFPQFFKGKLTKNTFSNQVVSTPFIAFIIGSLMPIFDDLFAFLFGPPFAHHSLFHSFFGVMITYILFRIISNSTYAKHAVLGNLLHIFFNFYFDYLTLFFPLTYQEFGLTDIIKVNTYFIKAVNYPIIFILFAFAILKFFHQQKNIK